MLDKLPAWARHLSLLVLGAVLTWAGTDLVPRLQDQPGLAALAAVIVTMLIAVLTPLTNQYGAFKE
jgi:hypothetical protein